MFDYQCSKDGITKYKSESGVVRAYATGPLTRMRTGFLVRDKEGKRSSILKRSREFASQVRARASGAC
jgi:hypothetical protein